MRTQVQGGGFSEGEILAAILHEDRRGSERHISVLQVAKLVSKHGEELCIVRDISSGGLKAEIYSRLYRGEEVSVAFKSGHTVSGKVAWADDRHIGVAFADEIDPGDLLVRGERDLDGNLLRAPRLRVDIPARLRVGGETLSIHLCDVSQDGCKIRTRSALTQGSGCEIWLPALGYRIASVRWVRDDHAGILLHERLRYSDFATWRNRLASVGI